MSFMTISRLARSDVIAPPVEAEAKKQREAQESDVAAPAVEAEAKKQREAQEAREKWEQELFLTIPEDAPFETQQERMEKISRKWLNFHDYLQTIITKIESILTEYDSYNKDSRSQASLREHCSGRGEAESKVERSLTLEDLSPPRIQTLWRKIEAGVVECRGLNHLLNRVNLHFTKEKRKYHEICLSKNLELIKPQEVSEQSPRKNLFQEAEKTEGLFVKAYAHISTIKDRLDSIVLKGVSLSDYQMPLGLSNAAWF